MGNFAAERALIYLEKAIDSCGVCVLSCAKWNLRAESALSLIIITTPPMLNGSLRCDPTTHVYSGVFSTTVGQQKYEDESNDKKEKK